MQFSIKHLIGWTSAVAVMCAILFGLPDIAGMVILALMLLWLPVFLICGIVYARNWSRTFFIGATIAGAPISVVISIYLPIVLLAGGFGNIGNIASSDFSEVGPIKYSIAAYIGYVTMSGFMAILARFLVAPRAVQPSAVASIVAVPTTAPAATQPFDMVASPAAG